MQWLYGIHVWQSIPGSYRRYFFLWQEFFSLKWASIDSAARSLFRFSFVSSTVSCYTQDHFYWINPPPKKALVAFKIYSFPRKLGVGWHVAGGNLLAKDIAPSERKIATKARLCWLWNVGLKLGQGRSNLDSWLTAAWAARLVCDSYMFTMAPRHFTWHWVRHNQPDSVISILNMRVKTWWLLFSLFGMGLCVSNKS